MQSPQVRLYAGFGVIAGIAALLCWLLWRAGDVPPIGPPRDAVEVPAQPGDRVTTTATAVAREAGQAPAVVEPLEAMPEADLRHPFSFSLEVVAMDRFALPVSDALVFVAPPRCGFSRWPEVTDAGGRVQLEWHGRRRHMQVQVALIAWGVLQPLRSVRIEAGRVAKIAIAVKARKRTMMEVLVDQAAGGSRGADWRRHRILREVELLDRGKLQKLDELDVTCGRSDPLFARVFRCADCHERGRVAIYSTLAHAAEVGVGLHPFSGLHDLRARGLSDKERGDRKEQLDASRGENERRPAPRRSAKITGVVRDRAGAAVGDVPVAWRAPDGTVLLQTRTAADGRYELAPLPDAQVHLFAGGDGRGEATGIVVANSSHAMTWDCTLVPTSIVHGSAVDADGKVLVDWRVELQRDQGDWTAWGTTDRDGVFRFAGVPGPVQCLLWGRDEECQLPLVYGTTALVDGSAVRLALEHARPTRARLRILPTPPAGLAKGVRPQFDARLEQIETGRVINLAPLGFEQALEAKCLPPGPYRVDIGAPGLGWTGAKVVIDGRGLWNIGRLHFAASGRVRFDERLATSPFDSMHAFYRRTEAVDVQVEPTRVEGDSVLLPPDDYVLLWRDGQRLRSRAFRVQSGVETVLR